MRADTAAAREERLDIACLQVAGQVYGVEVRQICEILGFRDLASLPRAPALIEGVIEVRGAVIPIVDLGRALHDAPIQPAPGNRIVVLEVNGLRFGLRVEAALEVLSLTNDVLAPPPELARRSGYEAIQAVVRREPSTPIFVLSLEHLLDRIQRSACAAGEARPT